MPVEACPICGKPRHARFAPFCSRRCSDIDLGRWLKGSYAIPGAAEGEKPAVPEPENEEDDKDGDGGGSDK